jgi:NitT/TauT family transport system substrate-binding protein
MTAQVVNRRTLLRSAVLAGVTFAVTRGALAQRAETINVGASPFINQGTIFIASEMGLFSKVGLDVKVRSFPDGALIVAPLLSGEIDIGAVTCSAALFNALSRGATYRGLLCIGQGKRGRAVSAINVRSDHYEAGIRTIPDLAKLKGKTVAVGAAGSINQYSISSGLGMAGLNPVSDVTWQTSVEQPDIVKQLGQKQVDAAELTYHLSYLAEKQGFSRIIVARDEILPDSQTAMLAARSEVIQSRRDALVRFAMAYIHAGRLFNKVAADPGAHPEQVAMITKYIFLKDVNILKAISPHWEWISEDGKPNVASVLAQQDHWADRFKLVERKVTSAQIFDLSIAEAAAARLASEKPFG